MGARSVALLVVCAALAGGLAGGLLVRVLDGPARTRTVVIPPSPTPPAVAANRPPSAARGLDAARLYAARSAGVVTVFSYFGGQDSVTGQGRGQGSGFVVSRAGTILTNAHVITNAPAKDVEQASDVYVEFEDGDVVPAKVVGWDLFADVGVLRVDPAAHRLDPVPLGDSATVVVGDPVAAIGSPFGRENTLTVGVVSATRRSISSLTDYDIVDAIQTDAAINHGNSGGPLFDARARVIGINAQISSESGTAEGVGFAVPINLARRSLAQLVRTGHAEYAYIGVSTDDLTPTLADALDYTPRYGAVVACVQPGSPAERAGLRGGREQTVERISFPDDGDVIVAIAGRRVRSGVDVIRIVTDDLRPGQSALFSVYRGSELRRLRVRLGIRPTSPPEGCAS